MKNANQRPNQPTPPQKIAEKIAKSNGHTDVSKKLVDPAKTKQVPR